MNSQVNSMLESIYARLVEADAAADAPAANAMSTQPSSGVDDVLQKYLSDLVDRLMAQYDTTDEDAADIVFACIDELVAAGKLPSLPEEGAPEDEVAAWIGKATTSGFPKYLDDFAAQNAETEDEEEPGADSE